jgi:hypothetical protein
MNIVREIRPSLLSREKRAMGSRIHAENLFIQRPIQHHKIVGDLVSDPRCSRCGSHYHFGSSEVLFNDKKKY